VGVHLLEHFVERVSPCNERIGVGDHLLRTLSMVHIYTPSHMTINLTQFV